MTIDREHENNGLQEGGDHAIDGGVHKPGQTTTHWEVNLITRTWLKSIQDSFWDEFSKGVSVRSVGGMKWHERNRGLNRMIASFQHRSGIHLVPPRALIEKDLNQHVGAYRSALNNYMLLAQRIISGDQEQITPEEATALGEAIMSVQHTQERLQACLRLNAQELPRKITTGRTE